MNEEGMEFSVSVEDVESVEVQLDAQEADVVSGTGLDTSPAPVEQERYLLGDTSEGTVEASVEDAGTASEVTGSLDAERVEQIVEALLESDRVTGLMRSMEETMQTVSDAVSVLADEAAEEPSMIVVDADELLDRLETRQAETAAAASAAVRGQSLQSVAAAPAELTSGGEVLVPGEGEISLTVIEALLESLISHFTEDGTEDESDILVRMKDTIEEISANVTPHPLMDTPFEEYSVLEGLLLVLVLWLVVLKPCLNMIKGGFSWLM